MQDLVNDPNKEVVTTSGLIRNGSSTIEGSDDIFWGSLNLD